jgi:hypothetical protein
MTEYLEGISAVVVTDPAITATTKWKMRISEVPGCIINAPATK